MLFLLLLLLLLLLCDFGVVGLTVHMANTHAARRRVSCTCVSFYRAHFSESRHDFTRVIVEGTDLNQLQKMNVKGNGLGA